MPAERASRARASSASGGTRRACAQAPDRAAASIAHANSAAFAAPASPIANVATGMPVGICTIDSSESSPRRYFDGTGTPSTGTIVFAASMPGRWAAPPAPAMIARRPRGAASSAYSNISSGIRCADSTRASYGMAKPSSSRAACFITSQSLSLPMTSPICGAALRCAMRAPGLPLKTRWRILACERSAGRPPRIIVAPSAACMRRSSRCGRFRLKSRNA